MAFSAVLDTNVLYPFSLRDTLLRLAELELYTPLWSARILEEMRRNLAQHRITAEQATRIEAAMRAAFEEAEIDTAEIERLEPAMTNDPKDRHVLAAAVAADSELIVTFDLDDFPAQACEPLGVEATHPDDFLLDLHDLNPEARCPPLRRRHPRAAVAWLPDAASARTHDGRPTPSQATRSPSWPANTGSVGARFWGQVRVFPGRLRVVQGKGATSPAPDRATPLVRRKLCRPTAIACAAVQTKSRAPSTTDEF